MPKYIRFQPLRIEIIFISKSSHITKAELFFVYGYGFVLTSLNYKEKGKKSKGNYCDTADFCNNRKKSKICMFVNKTNRK